MQFSQEQKTALVGFCLPSMANRGSSRSPLSFKPFSVATPSFNSHYRTHFDNLQLLAQLSRASLDWCY